MAEVVCGLAMTHNPRIFYTTSPPPENVRKRVFEVFAELRRIRVESGVEMLLVVGNHHLTTFLETVPPFTIGVSEFAQGPTSFEMEAGIPGYRCRVDVEASEHLLNTCVSEGFDVARASSYVLDHAFTIPLWFVSPEMNTPIVPVITNVHLPPVPSPKRFYILGRALAVGVNSYDGVNRVGVVASFNLSLNVGNWRMGRYSAEFDEYVVGRLRSGMLTKLVEEVSLARMAEAGNSTVELLNLFVLFGMLGDRQASMCFNEVIQGWGTVSAFGWRLV
ncbi:MAG: hypothetical protein QXS50_02415 [Candidatus Caldarchaeum sp.]